MHTIAQRAGGGAGAAEQILFPTVEQIGRRKSQPAGHGGRRMPIQQHLHSFLAEFLGVRTSLAGLGGSLGPGHRKVLLQSLKIRSSTVREKRSTSTPASRSMYQK